MEHVFRELERVFPIEYHAAKDEDADFMPNFLARSHRRKQAKLFKRLQSSKDDEVRRMARMEIERLYLPFHLLPVQSASSNFIQIWGDELEPTGSFIPGFGAVLDQAQANMREGIRRKITLPKSLATKVVESLERLADRLQGKKPEKKEQKKDGLPALADMIRFMKVEYIPHTRETLGYYHLGDIGLQMYDSLVRQGCARRLRRAA